MLHMTGKDYLGYIAQAAARIAENGDYVTALDAATGDGDHWVNINSGFKALVGNIPTMETMSLQDLFKKCAMTVMSNVGGSSGVLYGSAYLAASKVVEGKDAIDDQTLLEVIASWLKAMMDRGKAQPGFKTMIDALHPAVEAYRSALEGGADSAEALQKMKEASIAGMNATKEMEAGRGRATYQANKGIGHLDPGAVTMSMQLEELADYAIQNCVS